MYIIQTSVRSDEETLNQMKKPYLKTVLLNYTNGIMYPCLKILPNVSHGSPCSVG